MNLDKLNDNSGGIARENKQILSRILASPSMDTTPHNGPVYIKVLVPNIFVFS